MTSYHYWSHLQVSLQYHSHLLWERQLQKHNPKGKKWDRTQVSPFVPRTGGVKGCNGEEMVGGAYDSWSQGQVLSKGESSPTASPETERWGSSQYGSSETSWVTFASWKAVWCFSSANRIVSAVGSEVEVKFSQEIINVMRSGKGEEQERRELISD